MKKYCVIQRILREDLCYETRHKHEIVLNHLYLNLVII